MPNKTAETASSEPNKKGKKVRTRHPTFKEKTEKKKKEMGPLPEGFKAPIPTKEEIEKNKGGRPCKIDEAAPKIIAYVRKGNTYQCACGCARVSYNAFAEWMRRGKEDQENGFEDSKFAKLVNDIRQAEMDAENEIVGFWRDAMPQNWQACKEFLSRRNPESWASKEKIDLTSNGETIGKPLFLPMKHNDEEEHT
jgi:hypothetical protein